jgi:hypothetical protein
MRRPHRFHWRLKAVIQQLSVIAALPQRIEAPRSCLGWMAVASIGGQLFGTIGTAAVRRRVRYDR